ncbi:alanine racemase [Gryllotalpicola protaetiae]|uniref:Amino acid deaminase n=1 Tax=Gryllotalpicola protaetiae TaxID=2419771 RepID=A0A387BMF4_9MICO|nr:alanine racemase [Gryllotalpicola protaetiae]AYG03858.1 amino acid deaminase [Gryllotalpicola protaetiae]
MTPAADREALGAALAAWAEAPVDPVDKGFGGVPPGAIARELVGLPLADGAFTLPLLVVRESALEHNVAVMAAYLADRGALFAPHGKTTMSPEIVARQLEAGAWAITAADVRQAEVFYRAGARRVLIANEVADAAAVGRLATLLAADPALTVYCCIDSARGVALLDAGLRAAGLETPRLRVLVELGPVGGRAGVRTREQGIAVARAAAATGTLAVAGATCFEGVLGGGADDATLDSVRAFLAEVRGLGEAIAAQGLLAQASDDGVALVLSAGGSHYFDLVIDAFAACAVPGTATVVRSGSYVVHDHGVYLESSPAVRGAALPEFRPALEVHARVLSRPEPGLALLGAGRRDVSFDEGLPVVLRAERHGGDAVAVPGVRVTALNDQHAFLALPEGSGLQPGDRMVLGISHPCTTFDKWCLAALADDAGVVRGVIHTQF